MSHLKQDTQTVAIAGTRSFKPLPEHPGIIALRRALKSMRWDDQGGYSSYLGDGEWGFATSPVGNFTPAEMNALFDLVGVVPDTIRSKGSCADCKHAKPCERKTAAGTFITYHNRGCSAPCGSCKMPVASNFARRRATPKNFRHWCDWCGNLFETSEALAEHWRVRKASGDGCPQTGLAVL